MGSSNLDDLKNMTNVDLVDKCDKWVTNLCNSGGKTWFLHVPPDFENDPDMLFSELITRFRILHERSK